jgi:hypothetical protein
MERASSERYGHSLNNSERCVTQADSLWPVTLTVLGGVQEELAREFLDEAEGILRKLKVEGDSVVRASKVREEIIKIRGHNDMMRLSMVGSLTFFLYCF